MVGILMENGWEIDGEWMGIPSDVFLLIPSRIPTPMLFLLMFLFDFFFLGLLHSLFVWKLRRSVPACVFGIGLLVAAAFTNTGRRDCLSCQYNLEP